MAKQLSQCFTEAAELIETKGWGQGGFHDGSSEDAYNFCIIGACRAACPNQTDESFTKGLGFVSYTARWDEATQTFVEIESDEPDPELAYNWNDNEAQSSELVIALLRERAAILAAQGL